MSRTPSFVRNFLLDQIEEQIVFAYGSVDESGTILEFGGDLAALGLAGIEPGRSLQEQLLFTEGLIPMRSRSLYLPLIRLNATTTLDVHCFQTDFGYGLLFIDATDRYGLLKQWQEKLNRWALARATPLQPSGFGDEFWKELSGALDLAVFRIESDSPLRLAPITSPTWLTSFPEFFSLPAPDSAELGVDSFLAHFLREASTFWKESKSGSLHSGTWTERDPLGNEHSFEATAVCTRSHRSLIITHNPHSLREQQQLIQKARELAMDQRMLKRAQSELLDARMCLEATVTERTAGLERANLQLVEELKLREQLERQQHEMSYRLQQAQKMETIGTLAGGIAHDFNNLLAAILGFTELSIPEVEAGSALHDNLEQILSAVGRARELTRQILLFSRQSKPEKQPIELQAAVTEALGLMRGSLPPTVTIERDLRSSAYVIADPVHMHQVVMNLCTNAIQAIQPDPGTLSVSLRDRTMDIGQTRSLDAIEPGDYVELSVRDTGSGMPPEVARRVFEPFYTTKREGEGTGMGLSVVHGIVRECGGSIQVQSQPGVGTAFTVLLPRALETPSTRYSPPPPIHSGSERILFVDDDAVQVALAQRMLGHMGYEVATATGFRQALALFCEEPNGFDLVISDVAMPGMDGDTLSEQLKAIDPEVRIILCSGSGQNGLEEHTSSDRVAAYVTKPISMSEMGEIIARVLHGA